jgi:hypothetical protein
VLLFFGVIAAALVVAVVIGGDVRRLSQISLEHPEVLVAALACKVAVALLGTSHSQAVVSIARPLNVLGAILLLVVVWFNRRVPGALLFGFGLTLNLLAIAWFGGRMPVLLPEDLNSHSSALALLRGGLDPLHVQLTEPTGLWFLGDIFAIPGLSGHVSLVSAGDVLMSAGIAWLIIRVSRRPAQRPTRYESSPSH